MHYSIYSQYHKDSNARIFFFFLVFLGHSQPLRGGGGGARAPQAPPLRSGTGIDHWCSVVLEKSQPSCRPFSGKLSKPRFPLERCALGLGFFYVSKGAKNRNRYNQVPHLTQDTNGKVTNSQ